MKLRCWIERDGPVAWRSREVLKSAAEPDEPIFPPTFMKPQEPSEKRGWSPYVIDRTGQTNSCLFDSAASQGNRMEEIFLQPGYRELVPQNAVAVTPQQIVPFVSIPHRVADSVVRFSGWREEVQTAILAMKGGDAELLARLAPTSLCFGFYDGRGTGYRTQRVVKSTIRATDVDEQHHRGQYIPPVDYIGLKIVDPLPEDTDELKGAKKVLSEIGLLSSPTHKANTRGGVVVHGEIVRRSIVEISMLRKLRAGNDADTEKLQRYLLGLALVAATYPQEYLLREGCLLRRDKVEQTLVLRESEEKIPALSHAEVLAFAKQAAEDFGVTTGRTLPFDRTMLSAEIAKTPVQRKKERRAKRSTTVETNGENGDDESEDEEE